MKKNGTLSTSSEADAQASVNSKKKTSKKFGKALIIILVIVLLAVIGALASVIISLLNNDDDSSNNGQASGSGRDTVVTLDNRDQILSDLDKAVSDGLFEMKMNMEWRFEDASTPSENAYVANVTTNSNTIYFDVILDSNGQKVYESPLIPVGYALNNITLKADLEAGTYPCTLIYHLVDENEQDVSTVAVAITLKVNE